MKWFKHYTKAHRDTKIKKLINEFGADGYAVYFYSLELIADGIESDNITFQLEDDAQLVGQYLKLDTLKVEAIMKKCISLGLLGLSNSGNINCFKMAKFLDERFTRNPQLKKLIKSSEMSEVKLRLSEDKSKTKRDIPPQIRLDKIRLDKINKYTVFKKPEISEITAYCKERKNKVNAEQFYDYYESKGWMIGKNKMKDWHAAVRTWERNDFGKEQDKLPSERMKEKGII